MNENQSTNPSTTTNSLDADAAASAKSVLGETSTPTEQVNTEVISPQNATSQSPGTPNQQQAQALAQNDSAGQQGNTATSAAQATPSTVQGNGVVTPHEALTSATGGQSKTPNGKKDLTAKILAAVGGVAVLIAVYVFGFYLPNTPENVWSSGLNNTGKALEVLLEDVTKEDNYSKLSKSELTVTADANWADYDFEGSFNSKFNDKKSSSLLEIDAEGAGQVYAFTIDAITNLDEGKIYPDLYFRIGGLSEAAGNTVYSDIANMIEDKWIRLSSDYLEGAMGLYDMDLENKDPINSEDTAQYVAVLTETSNKYIFTDDPEFAVINNDGFIQEEEVEGVTAYKYDASVNKGNFQKYCIEFQEKLFDTDFYKKLQGQSQDEINDRKEDLDKDCERGAEDIGEDSMFSVWINKQTKLLHKVRFYESNQDKTNYVDIGVKIQSLSTIEFFTNYVDGSESTVVNSTVSLDTRSYTASGTLSAKQTTDNGYDVNVTLEMKPYDGEVKADAPSDYTDFEDLMNSLYGGYALGVNTEDSSLTPNESQADRTFTESLFDILSVNE